jgi:hypothetical protein
MGLSWILGCWFDRHESIGFVRLRGLASETYTMASLVAAVAPFRFPELSLVGEVDDHLEAGFLTG